MKNLERKMITQKEISDIIYEEAQYTDDFPIKRESANLMAKSIMNVIKRKLSKLSHNYRKQNIKN